MVDNQHQKIKGYRELSEEHIKLINALKELGETVGGTIDALAQDPAIDQRWLAIGKTHLQQGFMALTRSVAKPEGF